MSPRRSGVRASSTSTCSSIAIAPLNDPDLVLPHPHIGARAFVLAPLMDIAPDLVISGKSVRAMYEAVDASSVEPLE